VFGQGLGGLGGFVKQRHVYFLGPKRFGMSCGTREHRQVVEHGFIKSGTQQDILIVGPLVQAFRFLYKYLHRHLWNLHTFILHGSDSRLFVFKILDILHIMKLISN